MSSGFHLGPSHPEHGQALHNHPRAPNDVKVPQDGDIDAPGVTADEVTVFEQHKPSDIAKREFRHRDRAVLTYIEHQGRQVVVKWGHRVSLSEAQCQWYAWNHLHNEGVPIPKVYGWRTYNNDLFLYMECVPGETYARVIERLGHQVEEVDKQLKEFADKWRTQVPHKFGPADGRERSTHLFNSIHYAEHHHEHLSLTEKLRLPNHHFPYFFGHNDVSSANVMVEEEGAGRYKITGIIDWEFGGWYPLSRNADSFRHDNPKNDFRAMYDDLFNRPRRTRRGLLPG